MMGTTHLIKERQGTHGLKRGDVIFSRILAINNQSIFIGMAPFIIPAAYHNDLIDFRKWLLEEVEKKQFVPEDLRNEVNIDLLEYFFEIMEAIYNEPLPTLCNTDGDLLQFCKSYFKLTVDPEEALTCLLSLTLSSDPDEFLQDAKRDKTGNIKKIEFQLFYLLNIVIQYLNVICHI
jgi:hypothetical protein